MQCGVTQLETVPKLSPQVQEVALMLRTVKVRKNHYLTYATHIISETSRKEPRGPSGVAHTCNPSTLGGQGR